MVGYSTPAESEPLREREIFAFQLSFQPAAAINS